MTNRDINHILAGFDRSKATAYDKDYADRLYREYQNRAIDDTAALDTLRTAFGGKTVLVLPNNKNIIMASEQAQKLADRKVIVLPTAPCPRA